MMKRMLCMIVALMMALSMVTMAQAATFREKVEAYSKQQNEAKYPALSKGSTGDAVRRLQEDLIFYNYLPYGEADGSYGAKTAYAVHRYKQKNHISDDCERVNQCVATSEMQAHLFGGSAEPWSSKDDSACIHSSSQGQWQYLSGDRINVRFEVTNTSASESVKAFELYVYAEDVWGDRIWGETTVYRWTTETTIRPCETAYSSYVTLSDKSDIYKLHVAVKRVRFSDGSMVEIDDSDLDYFNWTIE